MQRPLVSIVITTRNEERNIERCIQALQGQSYPDCEIIVVDNASTDRTQALARRYTPHVFEKGPERSAQRNFGMIDKASGKYVCFVDADMIFSPDLIEACVNEFEGPAAQPGLVALHLPEIILGKRYFSRVRRFERTFYDGTVIDGARFFLRDKFIESGGFDVSMSGPEDWDIDKRIKAFGRIGLLPRKRPLGAPVPAWNSDLLRFLESCGVNPRNEAAAVYHNEAELELGQYFNKKNYYSKSFDAYVTKWGARDADVRRQLGARYRFFGVFLENGKFLRLLARPDLVAGMYFLRGLVGTAFVKAKLTRALSNETAAK